MNNKTSANDLSLSIHKIYKKYNMKEYYKEYCTLMSEYASKEVSEKLHACISENNNLIGIHGIVKDFINGTALSDNLAQEFIDRAAMIQTRYPFLDYCKECIVLRRKFLAERIDYFYNTIQSLKIVKETPNEEANDAYSFQDSLLAKWIDNSIKKTYPKGMQIKYEDLTGKVSTIYAIHKESTFDTEFSEAQLIDRYSGICLFDSFLLHSFYDTLTHKWVYVPLALIIDMKSDYITELLENMKEEEHTEEDDSEGTI